MQNAIEILGKFFPPVTCLPPSGITPGKDWTVFCVQHIRLLRGNRQVFERIFSLPFTEVCITSLA